jgi:hypothetical protein
MNTTRLLLVISSIVLGIGSTTVAQDAPPANQTDRTSPPAESTTALGQNDRPESNAGTVVSVSRQTMVVRTEDNQFHLFTFSSDMVRPQGVTPGARIRVTSMATDEPGVRVATGITVLGSAPAGSGIEMATPPKEMRDTQRDIERLARRWAIGVRVGAGLDPELFSIGAQTSIGPIFSRDFFFRPNAEFAFGELTDMVAINLEGAYRLPITSRQGRWSSYVGAGPALNFVHQGVDKRDISFSNFDYQTGLNVFAGVRFRRGTFAEVKTSLWAPGVPTLRLILGYTF